MKKILLFWIATALAMVMASCSFLDVVGKDAARAFDDILSIIPAEEVYSLWAVSAPDGQARFLWDGNEASIEASALPFLKAGLDPDKLPNLIDGIITVGVSFRVSEGGRDTPDKDFRKLVEVGRSSLNYHTAMDHYNIDLGDGNLFEWAKDMDANDKDIVFALNPEPFIAAGLEPNVVEGWAYTQVAVDKGGKTEMVWKFLKPFDLVK